MFSYADRIIPPSFTRKLKETPGVLGSSALLECKVSGSPPISVAWFHNGLKLVSGEKHQISFSDNLCILEVNSLATQKLALTPAKLPTQLAQMNAVLH